MKDLTKWWLNYMPLNNEEQKLIEKYNTTNPIIDGTEKYSVMEKEYFDRMPFCNLSNEYHITFSETATNFINSLFNDYVDDDTLIISSCCEHTNVNKNLEKYNNKLLLTMDEIISLKIEQYINYIKQYKKVFVYIIGTQISNGVITPQVFFEKLKKILIYNNIQNIFVLDDVHGMFITPRDYSLFDYIIYTAHSLIRNYDMGLLISKNEKYGYKALNWGKEYLEMLDIIIKRMNKMRMFSYIMTNEFYEYISNGKFIMNNFTTPHIFAPMTTQYKYTQRMYDMLDKNEVRLEGIELKNTYIRFRAQHYIKNPEYLTNSIKMIYNILDNIETQQF